MINWRSETRVRVGLGGPHRPLEQTPAICSSLRAGHPEHNLYRGKTIKVWRGAAADPLWRPTSFCRRAMLATRWEDGAKMSLVEQKGV